MIFALSNRTSFIQIIFTLYLNFFLYLPNWVYGQIRESSIQLTESKSFLSDIFSFEQNNSRCPDKEKWIEIPGHGCYLLEVDLKLPYDDAQMFCQSQNAHLVEINNQMEQDGLASIADWIGIWHDRSFWMGIERITKDTWQWSYSKKQADYLSFAEKQDSSSSKFSVAIMSKEHNYEWVLKNTTESFHPLCEKNNYE